MIQQQRNQNKINLLLPATIVLALLAVLTVLWFQNQNPDSPVALTDEAPITIDQSEAAGPTLTTQPQEVAAQATSTPIFQPIVLDNPEVASDYDETGVLIFSMTDGLFSHLFVYHPGFFPLTRLTNNNWDDIHPALSKDGKKLAYASKQNGYWDIYVLDLTNYQQIQITDSPAYDGFPTWSPDGKWIAFESYLNGNLDIFIQSMDDLNSPAVQLTNNEAADYQPDWSPDGRKILFTSLQNGEEDIWLSDLDSIDQRYTNVSQEANLINTNAHWNPETESWLWSTQSNGSTNIDIQQIESQKTTVIPGNAGYWSPTGRQVVSIFNDVLETKLGIFDAETGITVFPFSPLPGKIHGLTWGNKNLEYLLPLLDAANENQASANWTVVKNIVESIPANRIGLVELDNVDAPYPYLLDTVNESFEALRKALISKTGWDYLADLDNAYTPITSPAAPEILENWLSTGRAIQISDAPMSTNWLLTIREEINGKTYWRIYLRAIDQTGASGIPLHERAWSFDMRTQGSPAAYEQGGNYTQNILEGYWVDFTELAAQYDWERIPSLLNWRTYYPGTQHSLYVFKEAETLESALLNLYPPEALLPQANNSVVPLIPTPTPLPEEEE